MTRLEQKVLQLSITQKERLRDLLNEQIDSYRDAEHIRNTTALMGRMRTVVSEVLGIPRITETRERSNILARTFMSYYLVRKGFAVPLVAKLIGRDRTTIIHMREEMNAMLNLPAVYRREISMYKQFKKRIDNDTQRTTIQGS